MTRFAFLSSVCFSLVLVTPVLAQQTADAVAPEGDTSITDAFAGLSDAGRAALDAKAAGTPVSAENWMVAAANPLAVEAGADVLRAGGSAADAMVAVQAVLGLVEPQSSGLGGGAFLVWYDADTGEVTGLQTASALLATYSQADQDQKLEFFQSLASDFDIDTVALENFR